MNIDALTVGQLKAKFKPFKKEINMLLNGPQKKEEHPYKIGDAYLIRTVTMTLAGRLKCVCDKELVIEQAAWIADTGRFSDALRDMSVLNEIEPFPDGEVIVGRGSIIDAVIPEWGGKLPKVKK